MKTFTIPVLRAIRGEDDLKCSNCPEDENCIWPSCLFEGPPTPPEPETPPTPPEPETPPKK